VRNSTGHVSGNWFCGRKPLNIGAQLKKLEDGSIARFALMGKALNWIEGDDDASPKPIEGEAFAQPVAQNADVPKDFPLRIIDLLREVAGKKIKGCLPWVDGEGVSLEPDADNAIAWIQAHTTPQAPAKNNTTKGIYDSTPEHCSHTIHDASVFSASTSVHGDTSRPRDLQGSTAQSDAHAVGVGDSVKACEAGEKVEGSVTPSALETAVEAMVQMLEDGEWAEHVSTIHKHPLASRLESAITDLHNEIHEAEEAPQSPALTDSAIDAAMAAKDAS